MVKIILWRIRMWLLSLWGLLALALCLRLLVMSFTSGLEYDIVSYHIQAQSVFDHRNIYDMTNRYPYPPVWVWLMALAQWLANITPLPFVWLVRVPGVLGDLMIVWMLWRSYGTRGALFYAVNPVAIIISAGHGQFDGLVMAFVIGAWVIWRLRRPSAPYWAALALGGAIALKGYPVLLLPFLVAGLSTATRRLAAALLALLPLIVAVLVYCSIFGLSSAMFSHILFYNGSLILGWSLYFPSLLYNFWPAHATVILLGLTLIGRIAVLLLPVMLLRRRVNWSLEQFWLATFLGFYVLAPGIAPQYLLWSVPLWAVVDRRLGRWFTVISLVVIWMFYLALSPGVVPWGPELSGHFVDFWLPCFAVLNAGWWLAANFFWWRILRRKTSYSSSPQKYERLSNGQAQRLNKHLNTASEVID